MHFKHGNIGTEICCQTCMCKAALFCSGHSCGDPEQPWSGSSTAPNWCICIYCREINTDRAVVKPNKPVTEGFL